MQCTYKPTLFCNRNVNKLYILFTFSNFEIREHFFSLFLFALPSRFGITELKLFSFRMYSSAYWYYCLCHNQSPFLCVSFWCANIFLIASMHDCLKLPSLFPFFFFNIQKASRHKSSTFSPLATPLLTINWFLSQRRFTSGSTGFYFQRCLF